MLGPWISLNNWSKVRDIAEILLKVALNTKNQIMKSVRCYLSQWCVYNLLLHSTTIHQNSDDYTSALRKQTLNIYIYSWKIKYWSEQLRTFLTNNYFKWTKCFISFIFTTERVFYNSHLYFYHLKHNYNYHCSCYFNIIFIQMF
jgi:hypothetical protein